MAAHPIDENADTRAAGGQNGCHDRLGCGCLPASKTPGVKNLRWLDSNEWCRFLGAKCNSKCNTGSQKWCYNCHHYESSIMNISRQTYHVWMQTKDPFSFSLASWRDLYVHCWNLFEAWTEVPFGRNHLYIYTLSPCNMLQLLCTSSRFPYNFKVFSDRPIYTLIYGRHV